MVNRFVGGGHKQRLRCVDFHRHEGGIQDVVRIEYDPGRSAHIALLKRRDAVNVDVETGAKLAETQASSSTDPLQSRTEVKGGWSYILAPEGLRAGDEVISYRSGIPSNLVPGWSSLSTNPAAPQTVSDPTSSTSRALGMLRTMTIKPGNVLPLYLIPTGTDIHNISLITNGRMQLVRSAGTAAQIVAHHGSKGEALGGAEILALGRGGSGTVLIKLQSGEVRKLGPLCVATVGKVSK